MPTATSNTTITVIITSITPTIFILQLLLLLLLMLLSKQLRDSVGEVIVVKSLGDQVLPSTASRLCGGWLQSGSVQVAGMQGGISDDKPLVQLFVVEDCSRS